MSTVTSVAVSAQRRTARPWLVFTVVATAQLTLSMSLTIANIALPQAQQDLGFADSQRQWIITAYALAFGSLLLLGGRLGDHLGHRRMIVVGLLGFGAASVVGGVAPSFALLVTARVLQGVFAAALAPAILALLLTTFDDPRQRATAVGVFGAIAGAGGGVGLVLGGALTQHLSWRSCFFVNVVLSVALLVAAFSVISRDATRQHGRIDVAGACLASTGLFTLVLGLSLGENRDWTSGWAIGAFVLAVFLLGTFVSVERKVAEPLLPLSVVLDRNRGAAFLSVALLALAMFSIFLFLTFFMQLVLKMSPVMTGVGFLAMIGVTSGLAPITNAKLLARFGPRRMIVTGMLFGAAGMALFTMIDKGSTYLAGVFPGLVLVGVAFAFVLAPAMHTATSGVARAHAGIASATVNAMQQIGGAIGTAILSAVAAGATTRVLASGNDPMAEQIQGWATAFGVAAAVLLAGAVLAFLLFPRSAKEK